MPIYVPSKFKLKNKLKLVPHHTFSIKTIKYNWKNIFKVDKCPFLFLVIILKQIYFFLKKKTD